MPRLISLPIVCNACSGHNPRTHRARPSRRTLQVKTNTAYIAHRAHNHLHAWQTRPIRILRLQHAGNLMHTQPNRIRPHQATSGNTPDPSPITMNAAIYVRPAPLRACRAHRITCHVSYVTYHYRKHHTMQSRTALPYPEMGTKRDTERSTERGTEKNPAKYTAHYPKQLYYRTTLLRYVNK